VFHLIEIMADTATRLFQIIEFLASSKDWVSLREMARELHISAASAYRALSSLKEIGYVRQHPQDGSYQLTLKIAWISAQLLENVQLRQIAHPFLQQLTSATNETTHLAVLEGTEFVYIDKVDNAQAVRMRSRVGQRGRLYCAAVGKVMLAFMPETECEALSRRLRLQAATEHTITDAAAFREELGKVRELGYAVDDEENEVGIRCVGAPVYDHTGRLTAAVSISGWTITMTPERIPKLAPQLVQTCQRISAELGFGGDNDQHAHH
jgi:DNA-binding IclR family transcriptional regulator